MSAGPEARAWDWRELGANALVLLALASLAVTQPVLDLFGNNPEFFVAGDQSPIEIVLFALVVALVVPAVAVAVEIGATAIRPDVGEVTHRVLVALLAAGFGLTLARGLGLGGTLLPILVAVVVASAVVLVEARVPVGGRLLRYLAPASLLFLVTFLFLSDSSELIWSGEAEAVDSLGARSALDSPVVILQLDELPL